MGQIKKNKCHNCVELLLIPGYRNTKRQHYCKKPVISALLLNFCHKKQEIAVKHMGRGFPALEAENFSHFLKFLIVYFTLCKSDLQYFKRVFFVKRF